jgi:hypothetical protein
MTGDALRPAALEALSSLLAPLIPLLLELGVGTGDVETEVKRLYVRAAEKLAAGQRKPRRGRLRRPQSVAAPSTASIAMLTGLTRSAVQKLQQQGSDREADNQSGYQRAERVISGWLHDPDFRDMKSGRPAILPLRGPHFSFTELVRRHSGDARMRTLLTELKRVRAIKEHPGQRWELVRHSYAPAGLDAQAVRLVGARAADYVRTLVQNLQQPGLPLYARTVVNSQFDARELGKLLRDCALHGNSTLESLDAALNDPSATVTPAAEASAAMRLGATFFIFEQRPETAPSPEIAGQKASTRRPGRRRAPR